MWSTTSCALALTCLKIKIKCSAKTLVMIVTIISNTCKMCDIVFISHAYVIDKKMLSLSNNIVGLLCNVDRPRGKPRDCMVVFSFSFSFFLCEMDHHVCTLLVKDLVGKFLLSKLKLECGHLDFMVTSVWVGTDLGPLHT